MLNYEIREKYIDLEKIYIEMNSILWGGAQ
jgi:hypothetical protein